MTVFFESIQVENRTVSTWAGDSAAWPSGDTSHGALGPSSEGGGGLHDSWRSHAGQRRDGSHAESGHLCILSLVDISSELEARKHDPAFRHSASRDRLLQEDRNSYAQLASSLANVVWGICEMLPLSTNTSDQGCNSSSLPSATVVAQGRWARTSATPCRKTVSCAVRSNWPNTGEVEMVDSLLMGLPVYPHQMKATSQGCLDCHGSSCWARPGWDFGSPVWVRISCGCSPEGICRIYTFVFLCFRTG